MAAGDAFQPIATKYVCMDGWMEKGKYELHLDLKQMFVTVFSKTKFGVLNPKSKA